MGNTLRFKADMDDNVSKKLGKIDDQFGKINKSSSVFGRVGAKGVAIGFGLIAAGAAGLTAVLGASITAAMEEEESISKLDAALTANIAGWDGNTAAMERVLAARMALGFSDDEQRASLALLVAATNDVSRSLEIQRTAMDLARLKNIDLMTATEALIRVDSGQYRLLKSLGIELAENATQTDALRAVQVLATGQADAFAQTTSGKLTVAQIAMGEAMETLGTEILPMVAAALGFVANFVVQLVREIKVLVAWVGEMIGALERGIKKINNFLGTLGQLNAGKNVGWDPISDFISGKASGGWVGMNGPELIVAGEKGPEYVRRAGQGQGPGGGGGGHGHAIVLDGKQLARAVDKYLASTFGTASLTTRGT